MLGPIQIGSKERHNVIALFYLTILTLDIKGKGGQQNKYKEERRALGWWKARD